MTDKEYSKQKKRIQNLADKWLDSAGFRWWRIHFDYCRLPDENNLGAAAEIQSQWQYRKAHITFYMPTVAEMDDDELEEAFVHELCHILIDPVISEDTDPDKHEYATECVARALVWTKYSRWSE